MRTSSPYHPLKWLVECNMNGRFYETIGAFNNDRVAMGYANECKTVNGHNSYRVQERTGKGWKTIYEV